MSKRLPIDTRSEIINNKTIDNFYLKFHKFPMFDKKEKKFCIYKYDKKKEIHNITHEFDKKSLEAVCNNYYNNIKKLNLITKTIDYITEGRLAMGMGNVSVYETSMCLHYIYGFPYIPGQTIKGVLRSYIVNEVFVGNEGTALNNSLFRIIFGCDDNEKINATIGQVLFFDAYPINGPKLKPDVMSPHYFSYYTDKSNNIPPVDYDDTIPINFMTVENTTFRFVYGVKRDLMEIDDVKKYFDKSTIDSWKFNEEELSNISLIEIIYKYLKEAIEQNGMGAKTAVGYGYFNIDKEQEKRLKEKQLKEEQEKNFKEITKDMNELEIELYKADKIQDTNKKNDTVMKIYKEKIDLLKDDEQKKLALYVKEYLESIKKWKYKVGKNGKCDKTSERVEKICSILKMELPSK